MKQFLRLRKSFGLIVAVGCASLSLSHGEFSQSDQEQAQQLVERLEADEFEDREAAMKELEGLPEEALPWLEEMIAAAGPTEIELRSRLKSIVRTLKKRGSEEALRVGTRVEFDLKESGPGDVLDQLETSVGRSLTGESVGGLWDGKPTADLAFSGSYWEAVNAMLQAFPPQEGERENLGADYRITRWGKSDFGAAKNPSTSAGILRVRHARMALENSGGTDRLVVTLVPNIEPGYQVEGLALLLRKLKLEDGTVLEPAEKVKSWKAQYGGTRYGPGAVFTWIFPLEKGIVLRGNAAIEGAAEIRVRRNHWAEVELPEGIEEEVDMTSSVKLKVLERDEGRLKIQFEGSGSEPAAFDDYELRKEAYKVLDKDGNVLDFRVNSSSSGGGDGWRNSYGGKIEGEPARVRASLPGGEQKVELAFDLGDLPLPGSSLLD